MRPCKVAKVVVAAKQLECSRKVLLPIAYLCSIEKMIVVQELLLLGLPPECRCLAVSCKKTVPLLGLLAWWVLFSRCMLEHRHILPS